MKVELDLSAEQLQELDNGLMNLIKTLSEDQKTEIVKSYLQNKMDENFYSKQDSIYSSKQLSNFGKEVVEGLREKVADNITDDILSNKDLTDKMDEITKYIIRNLQEIIEQSISKYIVDNLFASKYMLDEQIRRTIWDMKNGGQI